MKINPLFKPLLILVSILSFTTISMAQDAPRPPQSPKVTATGTIGKANVSIVYSSPSVKGRKIWGELVPYGKVWRAGANTATMIETDADVKVGDNMLPKGKYSIYMLPTEGDWQVIFNTEVGQWGIKRGGETTRNPEKDVFTISVKPGNSEFKEALEYKVVPSGIAFGWENKSLLIPVK
ncbi:DUF2911 domain-containing protein [Aquirufa rosea]|uniref:DUF2911 domain-containing protein n=1 Tax=Aquirufa rosea TaxID=2509241 RepID=A0A4V1M5D8_9BACT|nr:DUF2911 domain-containing protein [Aquirufa rosea]RXK48786.1 DUF2911 domain-containing protein [Aquirufa rosea]